MSRILLWGYTTPDMAAAARTVREQRPGSVWVGKDPACDYRIVDFYEYDLDRLAPLLASAPAVPPPDLAAADLHSLYAMMQRGFYGWQCGHADLQQLVGLFTRIFDALLAKHAITTVWFAYVPHLGIEMLLYHVAKARGLRVRMAYQSLFPGRVFLTSDPSTFGHFDEFPAGWPDFDQQFTFGQPEQDLFYMRNLPPPKPQWRWLLTQFRVRLQKWLRGKLPRLGVISLAALYRARADWLRDRAQMAWDAPEAFAGQEYVYFPLHLQPELSTDPLGGIYGDQALAVETLRRQLPAHVAIVIKENPKQDFEWRDHWFYERLRRIPGVYLVATTVNTYRLMNGAVAVATITGTAGWEAVLGGKPAIVYGGAWYLELPGVFDARDGLDWDAVRAFRPDFTRTRAALAQLASRMPSAIIDLHYAVIDPAYDPAKNRRAITDLVLRHD